MAKTKISEFSATPANNTDIDSINIAEGCAPSGINDAIRELMAQLKDFQTGAAGDSFNGPVGTTTAAAGSFTTLAYTGALTGGTGVVNLGSGQFYKDASGNVGIGTSSPTAKLHVSGTSKFTGDISQAVDTSLLSIYGGSAYNTGAGVLLNGASHPTEANLIRFTRGAFVESARIDSSGNLLVGTTSVPSGSVGGGGFVRESFSRSSLWLASTTTSSANIAAFWNPNGVVGAITTNGSSTSYVTSSDYRLKESISPMVGALAVVQQLKPVTYKWKADGSDGQGFIAHELAEVVPDCVTGEKDAVDAEGNPQYQGIDTSFLVATLTAAIQEQQAIITALTARVAALESN